MAHVRSIVDCWTAIVPFHETLRTGLGLVGAGGNHFVVSVDIGDTYNVLEERMSRRGRRASMPLTKQGYDEDDYMNEDYSDGDIELGYEDDDANGDVANEEADFEVVPEKDKVKSYEVESTSLSVTEVQKRMRDSIEHVVSIFGLEPDSARMLLREYGWNTERLIDKYMDSPTKVAVKAGIQREASIGQQSVNSAVEPQANRRSTRRSTLPTPAAAGETNTAATAGLHTLKAKYARKENVQSVAWRVDAFCWFPIASSRSTLLKRCIPGSRSSCYGIMYPTFTTSNSIQTIDLCCVESLGYGSRNARMTARLPIGSRPILRNVRSAK
ncbi:14785_t:CDS:2, partial [Acaulospora colombiana]